MADVKPKSTKPRVLHFGGELCEGLPDGHTAFYERNDMRGEIPAPPGHEVEFDKVKDPEKYVYFKQAVLQDGFTEAVAVPWKDFKMPEPVQPKAPDTAATAAEPTK